MFQHCFRILYFLQLALRSSSLKWYYNVIIRRCIIFQSEPIKWTQPLEIKLFFNSLGSRLDIVIFEGKQYYVSKRIWGVDTPDDTRLEQRLVAKLTQLVTSSWWNWVWCYFCNQQMTMVPPFYNDNFHSNCKICV